MSDSTDLTSLTLEIMLSSEVLLAICTLALLVIVYLLNQILSRTPEWEDEWGDDDDDFSGYWSDVPDPIAPDPNDIDEIAIEFAQAKRQLRQTANDN